jgi:hypothetical protein
MLLTCHTATDAAENLQQRTQRRQRRKQTAAGLDQQNDGSLHQIAKDERRRSERLATHSEYLIRWSSKLTKQFIDLSTSYARSPFAKSSH